MFDRLQTLTKNDLCLIHDASMEILESTGICFNNKAALHLFRKNGFQVQEDRVFFTETQVLKALETTVSKITLHARNPVHTVSAGEEDFICLVTGGAPNIATLSGAQRAATMADYLDCCKLLQTSRQVDMGGYLMVQPTDIPAETAHLDMIANYIISCDKPMCGASTSGLAAKDSIALAGIVWGGKKILKEKPVMASIVSPMSPLQYSEEQTEVLIEMAKYNQPVVISNMILAGASGPVQLPSLLALENAEILAGITLSQLVSPGAPVVYGSTSTQMDMKTSTGPLGAPEAVVIASATIQLAKFYNLPSRTGGSLTDAHSPDAQALAEGSLMLSTAIRNGANFIFHSCGQMGSYISMSFEKWLIDEELIGNLRTLLTPLTISAETIDVETIKAVGIGGQYLTHPNTFQHFKALSQPDLFNRKDYQRWVSEGKQSVEKAAQTRLKERLASYKKPAIDPDIEAAIITYVEKRKQKELTPEE